MRFIARYIKIYQRAHIPLYIKTEKSLQKKLFFLHTNKETGIKKKKGKTVQKNNTMYPSEKTRKIGLMTSGKRGEKLMRYAFGFGGSSVFLAAFIGLLIFSVFAKGTDRAVAAAASLLSLAAAAIFAGTGFLFIPKMTKKLDCGKNAFVINAGSALSKEELFSEAESIRDPFLAERNGDWLDVTWEWLNGYYINADFENPGLYRKKEIFKIMFRVNDDHTYDMLDCVITENTGANIKGAGFGKSAEVGRFQVKKTFDAIGVDKRSGKAGVNTYCLDTEELRRYMRKWFADRGYREN